jgi:3-methyladenine DNA glycosylase AlkC
MLAFIKYPELKLDNIELDSIDNRYRSEIFEKLINLGIDKISYSVKKYLIDSGQYLEELSKDIHYYVRSDVAKNANCSIEILENLSKDEKPYVRGNVATNTNCPVEILNKLSKDGDYNVRYSAKERLK